MNSASTQKHHGGLCRRAWRSAGANALLGRLVTRSEDVGRQTMFGGPHRLRQHEAPLAVWINRETVAAVRDNVTGFEPWPGLKPRPRNVSLTR